MKHVLLLLAFLISFINSQAEEIDPYTFVNLLAPRSKLPRALNSEDIQIRPNDPQPLFTPTGDYNHDGKKDAAVSGVFDLPEGPNKYFLLVASHYAGPRPSRLFYQEYDRPVFIHAPGTTGDMDPGDQAFSITFCSGCSDGMDFYWVKDERRFATRLWQARVKRLSPISVKKDPGVDPAVADQALKIAGLLKDVQEFVDRLKAEHKVLGTRVEPDGSGRADQVAVVIFEKVGSEEKIYDRLVIEVPSQRVLSRTR